MSRLIIHILLFIFLLTGCQYKPEHDINFYYWKSELSIDSIENEYLRELHSEKIYVRFFDLDKKNNQVSPHAIIKPFGTVKHHINVIPVVFITNRTFQGIDNEGLAELARQTDNLIAQIEEKSHIASTEIQIDCDWTSGTKNAYFYFLTQLQKISGKDVTSTLRLHQVKDKEKTGIPPVKKVYLMCYATSDPASQDSKNSILDIDLLKNYTENLHEYPLEMDIALPLYSWGVVRNHLGKIKLINGLTVNDMQTDEFKLVGENTYEIQEDLFLKGLYLNKGFTIDIEAITPALLQEAKKYMDDKLKKDYTIVYYHLDKDFLQRFAIEELR